MTQTLTIGVAAGVLTALLFTALLSMTPFGLLIYVFTPLPAFVAGLTHGHVSAAVAAGCATLLLIAAVNPALGLSYAGIFGVPGLLLLRQSQATRADPAGNAGPILALLVMMAGAFGVLNVIMLGPDEAAYRATLTKVFDTFRAMLDTAAGESVPADEVAVIRDFLLRSLPAMTALSWLGINALALWLAGRIAVATKRLAGPWPAISHVELPMWTLFTFMASLVLAYLGSGQLALAASAFVAAHAAGYLIQGLALIHRLTAGRPFRPGMLIALYVALAAAGYYVAFLIITFALAAPAFGWVGRAPSPPTNSQT